MADIKKLKGVSEKDAALVAEAESMLGPEPETMGFVKNLFWGNFREDLVLPYPQRSEEEVVACDQLLDQLEAYLKNEHPSIQIDQEQETPDWVFKRLFDMGVLGMTIPKEYGGLGMGITSYNKVLELIGRYCGSTAVGVSAHLSIGCGAIKLFGSEEQKRKWLPKLAREHLSAFCLSEPNVGCDAGGQETTIEKSEDGEYYTVNGEKKWATSAAMAGLFTVVGKQTMPDGKQRVTTLVCTPDMEGVDIFEKNRSKCGIRGTWQGRLRFTNVRVPKANLLHKEGKGLNVALTCLNFGRCTLSAGMLGGAKQAMDQSVRWSQTRYQFGRPIADFGIPQRRIARMSALCYAADAVLYMTTGMLDRHDDDIMLETAICKCFCSEQGWETVNEAIQIMGGESYMTENEVERIFRDSRLNLIVEGSNDVMRPFIFGYGGKQLAEQFMMPLQEKAKNPANWFSPKFLRAAVPLAMEIFLGVRKRRPRIEKVHSSLRAPADRLSRLISEHTYQFKQMAKRYQGELLSLQTVQARIADATIMLFAYACTLAKLDMEVRAGTSGTEFERDKAAAMHFFELAENEIHVSWRELYENGDKTLTSAFEKALKHDDTLPVGDFYIPEKSQTDQRGKGKKAPQDAIKQFPGDRYVSAQ